MKPRFRSLAHRPLLSLAATVSITIASSLAAMAQTNGTWSATVSGTWGDVNNWTGGTIADLGGSADFNSVDLPGATVVTIDSARSVGSMTFGDTGTGTAGTWSVAMGGFLTISGGRTVTTNVNTGFTGNFATHAATDLLTKQGSAELNLSGTGNAWPGPMLISAGSVRFKGNASSQTTVAGALTGTGTVAVVQSGSSVFQQFNDITNFTGTISVPAANIRFGNTAGIPAGTAAGQNATFNLGAAGNMFYRNGTNGTLTIKLGALTGTAGSFVSGGGSAGTGVILFEVGEKAIDCDFGGGFRDGSTKSALTKVGSKTLTLSGTNTHTGATTVSAGTLHLSGTHSGTGAVSVANGATYKVTGTKSSNGATTVSNGGTLTGTGSLSGTTTVANGATLAPGDGGVGNISFASLSLATGSTVAVEFGTGNDTATVQTGGTLTLASGVNIDVNGFNTSGTYTLFNVTGATVSGTPSAALTVVNGDPLKVYTFSSDANAVYLNIGESDPSNYWNVDGAGTWGTASNWTKNLVPNAPGANAKIGPGVGGAGGSFTPTSFAIDLDAVRTVGEIVLNDDFGTTFTIAPGTSGSLLMDNSAAISNIVVSKGSHYITAPVAVDAEDVSFDVGELLNLEVSGVISSSTAGGGIAKAGVGTLRLTGTNTYDGGTLISAGVLAINSASSLGDVTVPATFTGGTLRILNDLTDARPYQVSGASNAVIDTNTFNYTYGGVISPLGGATGGLNKMGAGTLTLSTPQTYTGVTSLGRLENLDTDPELEALTGGSLIIAPGATVSGSAMNLISGTLTVAGGSLTATATSGLSSSALTPGAPQSNFVLSSGSATFAGLNANSGNPSSNIFINLTGGTFSASSLTMGRCSTAITTLTQGSTTSGLYVNGATATITGALTIGLNSSQTNSTASARIDSGSLTVGGVVQIAIASPDRWSVLDVNGGTFTSTDTVTGVQIGSGQGGGVAFLVRNGTATAERIILQQPAASIETSLLNLSGGTLYVGAGGIVGNNNAGTGVLDVQLGTATLGAKASWTSAVAATLNGTTTIKAADALDAQFDITLSGVLSGAGGFTKTGAGTLTLSGANTYAGTTNITAGKLVIAGNQSGATGDVTTTTGTTLGGNGNIGGNVTIASGATHQLAVAATAGAQVTRVISGTLTLSGGDIIDLTAAATPAAGSYTLATATGGITGTLATSTINYNGITGTLDIVGGNSLVLTVTGSGYASWATAKGLTAGVNDGPTDDPDFDGVDNALEFVLGGEPLASDPSILPDLNASGTDFVFTFNRSDESEAEIALTFQHGTNLSSWTDVAIGAAGAGVVGVVENDAAPDTVTVTIPKGVNTSLFGRLQAVK